MDNVQNCYSYNNIPLSRRLPTSLTSVSRLSRQCWILSIWESYTPSRPVTGTTLPLFIHWLSQRDASSIAAKIIISLQLNTFNKCASNIILMCLARSCKTYTVTLLFFRHPGERLLWAAFCAKWTDERSDVCTEPFLGKAQFCWTMRFLYSKLELRFAFCTKFSWTAGVSEMFRMHIKLTF
jgi:hypothetical protein